MWYSSGFLFGAYFVSHLCFKTFRDNQSSSEVHCYADDTQLYLSFKTDLCVSHVEALLQMQQCIDDLRQWMLIDRLKLNDEKTEFLLVGKRQ